MPCPLSSAAQSPCSLLISAQSSVALPTHPGSRSGPRVAHGGHAPSVIFHRGQVLSQGEESPSLSSTTLVFLKNIGQLRHELSLSLDLSSVSS